jgi:hypothetical protein
MIERVPMVDPDDGKSQHRNCILLVLTALPAAQTG